MELKREIKSYMKDGKVVEYVAYYVEINGIKVYLKPTDSTARQILDSYWK